MNRNDKWEFKVYQKNNGRNDYIHYISNQSDNFKKGSSDSLKNLLLQ